MQNMTQQNFQPIVPSHVIVPPSGGNSSVSSDSSVMNERAYLALIEAMLQQNIEEIQSDDIQNKKDKAELELSLPTVMEKLSKNLSAMVAKGPTHAKAAFTFIGSLLDDNKVPSPKIQMALADAIIPVIKDYLMKNPGSEAEALKMLAPLMKKGGNAMTEGLEKAQGYLAKFKAESAHIAPAVVEAKVEEVMSKMGSIATVSLPKMVKMYETILPTIEKIHGKDPQRAQEILTAMMPVLANSALKGETKDYTSQVESFPQEDDGKPHSGDALVDILFIIQQFQLTTMNFQNEQGKQSIAMGLLSMKSAQTSQEEIQKKIHDQFAAEASRPWWSWIVAVFSVLVGAVLTALTGGAASTVLAAVVIGAFMASPAFNMCVEGISKLVQAVATSVFTAQFLAEDPNHDAAKAARLGAEKAQALGDIIGKVVMIAAMMVLSGGIGGIGKIATGAASSALSTGVKMAAFEGISGLFGSGVLADLMRLDPVAFNNNPNLAMWVGIINAVVGVVCGFLAGKKLFAGNDLNTSNLPAKLQAFVEKNMTFLTRLQYGFNISASATELAAAGMQISSLNQQAEITEELGTLWKNFYIFSDGVKSSQDRQTSVDTHGQAITEELGKLMAAVARLAGAEGQAVRKVIQS